MDKKQNSDLLGGKFHFLSPAKPPHLKTSVTKPQNVMLENVSPFFQRSLSSPIPTRASISRMGFANWTGMPEKKVTGTPETIVEETLQKQDVDQRFSVFSDRERDSGSAAAHLENFPERTQTLNQVTEGDGLTTLHGQIIQNAETDGHRKNTANFNKDSRKLPVAGQTDASQPQIGQNRAYTTSLCSSCNSDDSMIAQSRCSICDGCSTGTNISEFSQTLNTHLPDFSQVLDTQIDNDNVNNSCAQSELEMSPRQVEEMMDRQMLLSELDGLGLTAAETECQHHSTPGSNASRRRQSMSTEQLIFLLLRMVLAKYKAVTEDLATERKISISRYKSIGCLIQAVVLLSQKVKVTTEQFHKTQRELRYIQERHRKLEGHQKKIYVGICIVLVVNVCSIKAVQDRLKAIFRFFGIVENMKKINRTRKMIAENWRNIPSLLTEFWRIFIFHSRADLKKS